MLLSTTEDIEEMESLLRTLDIVIERVFIQKRSSPHRNTFLGSGKIKEVAEELKSSEFDLLAVNGMLKPSQHHALEMLFKKECVDRIGVILKIFAEHAHSREAKRQVTLATLRYEVPFLREWIHKAKSGERPGFLSGGAYATEVYYEHSRRHIRKIERDLDIRSRQRELSRKRRRHEGYFLVSLAGYTNAGKSAILNAMCESEVEVDGRFFSTLSTTTRRLKRSSENLLLTDTVGFISDLPPDLINAFNSTLEEIFLSDFIILVVDISEPLHVVRTKLATSNAILTPRLQGQTVLVVGNKVDRLSISERKQILKDLDSTISHYAILLVSAITSEGLDALVDILEESVAKECEIVARLPITDEAFSLVSSLHNIADVEQTTSSDHTHLRLTCSRRNMERIKSKIQSAEGKVIAVHSRTIEK